jgi:hypothetical protein
MRALLIAAITLSSALAHASGEDVARAKERLERARATLKDAIAKIERKNPSDADFEAAKAALDPLKAALDAGNELEAEDLPYAKLALEARKELRAGRERIEKRRVEVKSEGLRDDIEHRLATLDGEMERGDFDKARASIEAAQQAIAKAQPLVASDAELTSWLATVKAKVDGHLRTVEERQIGATVEKQKTKVEAGLRVLADAMRPITGELIADSQFKQAEGSVGALTKIIGEGKNLESRHREYAAFAQQAMKQVEAARRQIDERKTELASAQQKAEIDGIKQSVDQAVRALKSGDDEELIVEAEKAASILERMLKAAEALPAKSRSFATYLLEARRSLSAAQSEIAKKKLAVQLPNQKKRVEEARAELNKAIAELRRNDAEDSAFTLAEAAIENVEKVLQAGASFAERDPKYATYARELRTKLREHKTWLATRRGEIGLARQKTELQNARAALTAAMKRINGPNPADLDFDEAKTAATVLEKTIEAARTVKGKDAKFVQYLSDLKKSVATTKKAIDDRKLVVQTEGQRAKIELELGSLADALGALEGPAPNEAQFNAAADATQRVRAAIDAGAELEKKVARYGTFANQAKKSLQQATQRIEARKLELNVAVGSAQAEKLLMAAKAAVESVKREDATPPMAQQAAAAVKAARDELAKHAELEKRDKSYASFAASAKEQVQVLMVELEQAEHMIAFRKGPVVALSEGLAAAQSAAKASGLEEQKNAYAQAVARFQACQSESADLIGDHPKLALVELNLGSTRAPAKNVISMCAGHAETAGEKLTHVQSILAVYEGPAKSFEQAKALLAKGSLAEALAQFESCLEKGKILQHKHPKLAEQKFDVGGQKVTLSAVVADCQARAKTVREDLRRSKN